MQKRSIAGGNFSAHRDCCPKKLLLAILMLLPLWMDRARASLMHCCHVLLGM